MSKTSDLKQNHSELKSLLSGQCRLNFKGNGQKQSENKRKTGLTGQLTHLQNERYSRKKGLTNLIDEILYNVNIKKQLFHGKAMSGVYCHFLLERLDEIMMKVEEVSLVKLKVPKGTYKVIQGT